jgi:hypothetical protein
LQSAADLNVAFLNPGEDGAMPTPYLVRLVAEHLLEEDEALETIVDLVDGRPHEVFKL